MIILAGVIVLSLNNSGIIDKAQDAIDKTNLAEIKHLAQLAWAEAYLDDVRDESGLREAVRSALYEQDITEEDYKGYTIEVTTKGVNFVEKIELDLTLNHSGIIPEGGTYITGLVFTGNDVDSQWDGTNTITYNAGEMFPETVSIGDKYIYGDYVYMYGCRYSGPGASGFVPNNEYGDLYQYAGWGVMARGNKSSYDPILESISNIPIVCLSSTFAYADNITVAPKVPSTVMDMQFAFYQATNLITAPEIPSGVVELFGAFESCTSLSGTITINANPTNYNSCFSQTEQPIVLSGTSTMLEELAATSEAGNVTVKE